MDLNYSGSGVVAYSHSEYQCDLYLNKDQGGILIKISVKKPIASFLELPFNIEVLCGELSTGYKFTLVNCIRNNMENLVSEGRSVFTYLANYMFEGVGGKECNCIKLHKIVFNLSEIVEWGNISGYTVGKNFEILQNDDTEKLLFENGEYSVKYAVNSSMLPVHFTQVLQDEIVLKQSGNIEIAFKNDELIEKFESIFIVIKRLIEVATLKKIRLNRITGWSTDIYDIYGEKRCERAIDIVGCDLNKNQKSEKSRQMAWKWISLPELIENDSFTKYFSKYELLEPVVDLYLEILESSEMSVVRAFLNIVQALETYHSRFITNSIEEFQSRIDLVVLKYRPREFAQDDRTFLMANSYKFITLESRLADLLLAEFKVWFETGEIKRTDFPKVIAKTVNAGNNLTQNAGKKLTQNRR